METTYVMEADGVEDWLEKSSRDLKERTACRFEQVGPSEEIAKEHYAVHSERPFSLV